MFDWLIATVVLFLVCTLAGIPLWFFVLIDVFMTIAWYLIGDE